MLAEISVAVAAEERSTASRWASETPRRVAASSCSYIARYSRADHSRAKLRARAFVPMPPESAAT